MDRLLLFVSVGAMGFIAQVLAGIAEEIRESSPQTAPSRGARWLGNYWVVMLLLVGSAVFPFRSLGMLQIQGNLNVANASAPSTPDVADKDVVIVNAPNDFMAWHLPIMRSSLREPVPRHCWALNVGLKPVTVRRVDARTLSLKPDGGFVQAPWGRMFRGPAHRFEVGYRVNLTGLTIEVASITPQGMPDEVIFRFDRNLEDESLSFIAWEGQWRQLVTIEGHYEPFTLPEVGQWVRVSALDGIGELRRD